MELQENDRNKAKWVIRHYREIRELVEHIERKRPKLVSHLIFDEKARLPLPAAKQKAVRHKADRAVIISYVEGREIMDIVETVLTERMRERDADIMRDACVNGMSVTDAAERYHVSEKTVKRARLRMEESYQEELEARKLLSECLYGPL